MPNRVRESRQTAIEAVEPEPDAAPEALRRSAEEFRLLADAVPQLVWTARPDGSISFVNRRWFEYTHASTDAATGSKWEAFIHPDDLPGTLERWKHSLSTGEPYEVQYRIRRADGAYLWHVGRALPVRDAEGRITAWYGTCTDISELRRAEETIRQLSTPVLSVREHLLIVPLIGEVNEARARQLTEQLLVGIRQHRARVVVVDLTGVPTVDATVASRLVQTGEAARLLGAQFLVSGISREVAQAFTELGTALTGIRTVGDLQGAIEEAELILGEIAA